MECCCWLWKQNERCYAHCSISCWSCYYPRSVTASELQRINQVPSRNWHDLSPLFSGSNQSISDFGSYGSEKIYRLGEEIKPQVRFTKVLIFSKAWLQTVRPTIIAGLKTHGVYPINQSAIKVFLSSNDVVGLTCQRVHDEFNDMKIVV